MRRWGRERDAKLHRYGVRMCGIAGFVLTGDSLAPHCVDAVRRRTERGAVYGSQVKAMAERGYRVMLDDGSKESR